MFKRVMTVLISVLAMVFLALLMLRLGSSLPELGNIFTSAPSETGLDPEGTVVRSLDGTGVGDGHFRSTKYDVSGMPKHLFEVDMTPVPGTGRFDLKDPLMVLYSQKGERLYIVAPTGYIDTPGHFPSDIDDITKAELSGDVVVRQDRGTADRSDDIVFRTKRISYDRESGRLQTSDPVVIDSPEGVVRAEGMVIFVDVASNELREIQLLRDVRMVLQGRDLDVGLLSMTEGDSSSATAAGGSSPAEPGSAGDIATTGRGDGSSVNDGSSAGAASAGDGSSSPAAEETASSMYEFDLAGDVRVRQENKRILADKLVLLTRMKGQDDSSEPAQPTGTAPAPGGGAEHLSREAEAATRADRGQGNEEVHPADTADGVKPIYINCDGPMVIRPKPDAPAEQQMYVRATGHMVTMVDEEMTAVCRTMTYDGGTQIGVLDGKLEAAPQLPPMTVVVKQGDSELHGPRIILDRGQQVLHVVGAGRLTGAQAAANAATGSDLRGDQQPGLETSAGGTGDGESKKVPVPLLANWSQSMRATFENAEVVQPDGSRRMQQQLSKAEFFGRKGSPAEVKRGDELLTGEEIAASLTSDRRGRQGLSRLQAKGSVVMQRPRRDGERMFGDISAQQLDVIFRQTAAGDSEPAKLTAQGDVAINSPDNQIEAGELKVDFAPPLQDGGQVRLNTVFARQDVRLRRGDLFATADVLESDKDGDHIRLTGNRQKLAEVKVETHKFMGEIIDVHQQTREEEKVLDKVLISGRGEMHVTADATGEAADGAADREPEKIPISVTWTRKMAFDGNPEQNIAQFSGNVSARMPDTHLQTHDLWIYGKGKAAVAGGGDAAEGTVGEGSDLTRAMRERWEFERMVAVGAVVVTRHSTGSSPEAEAGKPAPEPNVQELVLRSGRLDHDVRTGRSGVDGPGRVTIKEFRPEVVRQADRVAENTTDIVWQGQMVYDNAHLILRFARDVVATVEGRQVSMAGSSPMNIQNGMLRTQDLRIFLQKPAEGAVATAAAGGGADILGGSNQLKLKQLIARDRTSFQNEEMVGSAESLTYDAERELMVLQGRKGELAEIWQRTADGSKDSRQAGERIMYWTQQKRAIVTGPEVEIRP